MAVLDAVLAKVDGAIRALAVADPTIFDPLLAGFGDHGAGPVYDTVTVDSVDLMVGQAWSGPPADPDAPEDGPQPAMELLSAMSQLVKGIADGFVSALGVFAGSVAITAATTPAFTSVSFDVDGYTHSGSQFTTIFAGDYDVSFSLWGDGTTDDTVVRAWIEVDSAEQTGTRAAITVPTTAATSITEGSCALTRRLEGVAVGAVIRMRMQKTVGSAFNLRRGSVLVRLVK